MCQQFLNSLDILFLWNKTNEKIGTVFLWPWSLSTLNDKARSQKGIEAPPTEPGMLSTPCWARHIQMGVGSSGITTEWFKRIWDLDSKQQQLNWYGWRYLENPCTRVNLPLAQNRSCSLWASFPQTKRQKRRITGSSHSKQGGPYLHLPWEGLRLSFLGPCMFYRLMKSQRAQGLSVWIAVSGKTARSKKFLLGQCEYEFW